MKYLEARGPSILSKKKKREVGLVLEPADRFNV
jgi:hypothetical protein